MLGPDDLSPPTRLIWRRPDVGEVWLLDTTDRRHLTCERWAALPADERARASRLHERVRDGRVAAWYGMRALLAGHLGVELAGVDVKQRCSSCGSEGHGKPFLPGSSTHFSLSHTSSRALVAIASRPVGVDVEDLDARAAAKAVEQVALGRGERAYVAAMLQAGTPEGVIDREILRLWVRMEAVAKATGAGVTGDLRAIDATLGQPLPGITVYDVELKAGVAAIAA